ncbi:MAG: hypothetical protein M1816_003615 [Peltula sp. TS41687]|nr:MAG: hypothetical protein M1816_003615 [Peltula sp. TS41687]
MGWSRRNSTQHQAEADVQLRQLVQAELEKASRDRLFAMVKELDNEGIALRTKDLQRHRREYIVPGRNYLWSLDGYCKLQHYGFEIYAAIDAYSRHFFRLAPDSWARSQLASSLSVLDLKVHREHLALITIHAYNLALRGSHPRLLSLAGLLQKCSNDNGNVGAQLNKTYIF